VDKGFFLTVDDFAKKSVRESGVDPSGRLSLRLGGCFTVDPNSLSVLTSASALVTVLVLVG